ncbi:hypothetical protein [Streptomyces sp. NPDC006997]|uniref:hypothetical protein n=1 Tax=Streptomyces sp. NPDC006997 TaxID=3155356 RepID=UPI0033FAEC6E
MKALLFGIVLGVLLLWPTALSLTATATTTLLGEPVLVAFVLGAAARPYLPTWRGWVR